MAVVEWQRGPRAISGQGALDRLGVEAGRLTGRSTAVLLVADPGVPALADRVEAQLSSAGLAVARHAEVAGDPKAEQVEAAASLARESKARLIIGLGGGSALDVAKLAAAAAGGSAPVQDYALAARPFPAGALPVIAIPTTAGTGSEATRVAIFSRGDGAKLWAWGDELLPKVALLDPEATVGLPPHLTAATGVDALVHAIEAATNRNADSFSRAPALEAVRLVAGNLGRAVTRGDDLKARGQVQLAAFLAGQAIDTAGTGVAHALGHALGTLGRVHHGRAVGLSLAVALASNAAAAPVKHAAVARSFGLDGADAVAVAGLEGAYVTLLEEVGLDRDLSALNLDPAALAAEAQTRENAPMLASNCRAYGGDELLDLCRRLIAA
ncbi:iron-containing alcohol dehydrogenase [Algihabitans albus]|uniref:iron-containing alcohol dehydrogenase n=1 Tax=Algihabitans albus TaxID=2164067 RepID=UPI000E5CE4F2|nr:iron-containing alcohol dehydrogenase [Algihabitans albus]